MKKTMTGMVAYSKMMGADLPEKTSTYTPISHKEIVDKVRSEIIGAGFTITREEYSCTGSGNIAVGSFGLQYRSDPHIELCASFMNSYNKRYAFRFSLGGFIKSNNSVFMAADGTHGSFKRMHTGVADIMSSHKIKEFIDNAGEYWDSLVNAKEALYYRTFDSTDFYNVTGALFFDNNVLNTFQMSQVKEEMARIEKEANAEYRTLNMWDMYSAVVYGVKEGNPTSWMNDLEMIHSKFQPFIDAAKLIPKSTVPENTERPEKTIQDHIGINEGSVFVHEPQDTYKEEEFVLEDLPNVLRVNYQPSQEEVRALEDAGFTVVIETPDFDEQEFDGIHEEEDEEIVFTDNEDFEIRLKEPLDIKPVFAKISDNGDPWDPRF
jgi:hypothetical protein